jgi:hypothetical protein
MAALYPRVYGAEVPADPYDPYQLYEKAASS